MEIMLIDTTNMGRKPNRLYLVKMDEGRLGEFKLSIGDQRIKGFNIFYNQKHTFHVFL